jgi:thiazole tautomerase (transcriptional regulator TenI)
LPVGSLLGRSVHTREEAIEASRAGGLDYLMFGHVFDTASKPGLEPAGLATLRTVAVATPLPVLAVGGITSARMAEVGQAGASGVAAIALFAETPAERLQVVVREASLAFDTPLRVP